MNSRLQGSATSAARQSSTDDRDDGEQATDVAHALTTLRRCIEDLGYTYEALAVAMGKESSYKSHIHRVVYGERPLTLEFLTALPDDVEGLYEHRRAEQFGRIVVQPLEGADAQRAFVAGLVGLLSPAAKLPVKTSGPIKAELGPRAVKVTA